MIYMSDNAHLTVVLDEILQTIGILSNEKKKEKEKKIIKTLHQEQL